jgi:hypothetical protein
MKMPLLIAHRGLFDGPDEDKENHPEQISLAIKLGFDCEIDLWCVDERLYLGHDKPVYLVDFSFLQTRGLWIHAKNLEALGILLENYELNYFWHENDDYALTSKNYIWTYPGKPFSEKSIVVMPEWHDPEFENLNVCCFGICSDFVLIIKTMWNEIYEK